MSSTDQPLQYSHLLYQREFTVASQDPQFNSLHSSQTTLGEHIFPDTFHSPTFSWCISNFSKHNSIAMEDLDRNRMHGDDFLDEIHPDDSGSQIFYHLKSQLQPSRSQEIKIDESIDDAGSSILSPPLSSLLTSSASAYNDVGEDIQLSSEILNTSQIPTAFLAKCKQHTGYC
ncbi:hypothetical protein L873DRAFT_823006 [Choiromyces venosus 120613-1]|uniref:Uncharacterized protein n=1 Tax=Choiromyces venosus 120613-1 TaxID=1336337 RepID=A0A3N4JPQ8_9PEZI|nr:hypothetical protein L873DRAFT_823006 [Choiromyces venosus 120613-1]